jgi:hypothetical protein
MNSTNGIENILEETIQRFFTLDRDSSLNVSSWINSPIIFETTTPILNVPTTDNDNDNDSIPDLIENPNTNPNTNVDERGMQLWSNMLEDYNTQMRMYQENFRTILDITQTFLPQRTTTTVRNTNTNNYFWRDLIRNNRYSIEMERMIHSLFPTVIPTTDQINSATTNFVCDLSNNPLNYQVCPISLEDFNNGELLTRIHHCGHIFKTSELSRWFTRNSHCPTCRYDIRHNR